MGNGSVCNVLETGIYRGGWVMSGIPVLMYHALEDSGHPAGAHGQGEQLYVLQAAQFREQMAYLYRQGFSTYLLEELAAMAERPEKAVVVTFDDGHESNYSIAIPQLKEFGFRAEFFVTSQWVGTPNYLKPEQIRMISSEGMAIGAHGASHAFISDLDDARMEIELRDPQRTLSSLIDKPIITFSAPGGRIDYRTEQVARRSGYTILCGSNPGLLDSRTMDSIIPRLAIRNSYSLQDFASLVSGDCSVLRRMVFRAKVLNIMKKAIGNRWYERFRNVILGDGN